MALATQGAWAGGHCRGLRLTASSHTQCSMQQAHVRRLCSSRLSAEGPSTSHQHQPRGLRVLCGGLSQSRLAWSSLPHCCAPMSCCSTVHSRQPTHTSLIDRTHANTLLWHSRLTSHSQRKGILSPPSSAAAAAVPGPASSDGSSSSSSLEGWPAAWQHRVTSAATPTQEPLASSLLRPILQWAQPLVDFYTLYREILQRMAVTLVMLVVMRAGLFIPLPGVDMAMLPAATPSTEGARLARALYGQTSALPLCLAELGMSPYINASILVTMLLALPTELFGNVPMITRLKEARKEGRTGQAYINMWINTLSLMYAVYWGLTKAVELAPHAVLGGPLWVPLTALALVAGTSIIQYCADQVSAHGIGSGSGLVICASVMADYADALASMASRWEAGLLSVAALGQLLAGYAALALAAVYIARTELRLPVIQYQRVSSAAAQQAADPSNPGSAQGLFAAARADAQARISRASVTQEYFPLPLNTSGMMSIIFAGALWYHIIPSAAELIGLHAVHASLLGLHGTAPGMLIYGLLVFALEFLPLGGVNPKEAAEYLGTMSVGIKGVVPGEATEQYIHRQLLACKFWGGLVLGLLAVTAQVFDATCMATLGAHLSATSLLIIVGTIMQSSRQIEALLEGPRLTEQLRREQQVISSLRAI